MYESWNEPVLGTHVKRQYDQWDSTINLVEVYENNNLIYRCQGYGCFSAWKLNKLLEVIKNPETPEPTRQAAIVEYQALS